MPAPILLSCYAAATHIAAPMVPFWLRRRVARGKELPQRWRERLGETTEPRPKGPTIWCHAASVGETKSALPLVNELAARGYSLVLTTGTVTSEQVVRGQLQAGVVHQFAPLDHGPWVDKFLKHWMPSLALRIDSELWPNTIYALTRGNIPIVQVNARLSAKAAHGWQLHKSTSAWLFSQISLVLAQSSQDRVRYAELGAANSLFVGNLKLAQPELAFDQKRYHEFRGIIGDRRTWLAASIHPGENQIIGTIHQNLLKQNPHVLLIVVPRHPDRAAEMAAQWHVAGLNVARRSLSQNITPTTQIYLADTMGELGLFYRLSRIVFIGKTLAVGGGQNPVEPAQLGCALVWGSDMSNFAEIAAELESNGCAQKVSDMKGLEHTISKLLADDELTSKMGNAAKSYVAASSGALDRVLDHIAPYLKAAPIR